MLLANFNDFQRAKQHQSPLNQEPQLVAETAQKSDDRLDSAQETPKTQFGYN